MNMKMRQRQTFNGKLISLSVLIGLTLFGVIFFGAGRRKTNASSAPASPEEERSPSAVNPSGPALKLPPAAGPAPAFSSETVNDTPTAEDISLAVDVQPPANRAASESSTVERVVFVEERGALAP
jgi:hypothetical protein